MHLWLLKRMKLDPSLTPPLDQPLHAPDGIPLTHLRSFSPGPLATTSLTPPPEEVAEAGGGLGVEGVAGLAGAVAGAGEGVAAAGVTGVGDADAAGVVGVGCGVDGVGAGVLAAEEATVTPAGGTHVQHNIQQLSSLCKHTPDLLSGLARPRQYTTLCFAMPRGKPTHPPVSVLSQSQLCNASLSHHI